MRAPGVERAWPDKVLRPGAIIARTCPMFIPPDRREQTLRTWAALANRFRYPPPPGHERWEANSIKDAVAEALRRYPGLRKPTKVRPHETDP